MLTNLKPRSTLSSSSKSLLAFIEKTEPVCYVKLPVHCTLPLTLIFLSHATSHHQKSRTINFNYQHSLPNKTKITALQTLNIIIHGCETNEIIKH